MKKLFIFLALIAAPLSKIHAFAPADSLGLPGDNFDLYAMLDLFKASANPEDFEKKLNTEGSHVNNLDLNEDGKIDYIRVIDNLKDKAHAIVLQVAINEKESQDVAVIAIEKKGDNSAQLQVIGDELLYGKDYIIEPGLQDSTKTEKKFQGFKAQTFVYVNVWYWPCVTYIYYPDYVIWVSPWYWMYYPAWWYPWPPYGWTVYYGWVYPCHHHYYYVYEHRMADAEYVYRPRRVASAQVAQRTEPARKRYEEKQKQTPPSPAPSRQNPPVENKPQNPVEHKGTGKENPPVKSPPVYKPNPPRPKNPTQQPPRQQPPRQQPPRQPQPRKPR